MAQEITVHLPVLHLQKHCAFQVLYQHEINEHAFHDCDPSASVAAFHFSTGKMSAGPARMKQYLKPTKINYIDRHKDRVINVNNVLFNRDTRVDVIAKKFVTTAENSTISRQILCINK